MVAADTRVATPLRAPRVGLLAAASVTTDIDGVRWGNGVEWLSEMPLLTSLSSGARALRCDPEAVTHSNANKAATEEAYPFSVFAFDWCTSLGFEGRDWVGRARRLLEATQSHSIAGELWTGTLAQAESLANVWLAKATADEVTTAAMAPHKALAVLDAHVASELRNGIGMIHVSVEVLNRLMAEQAIRRDGDRWRTAFDNIVVADGGYTGDRDGEDAATEWMVATTPIEIALGPIRTLDLTVPEDLRAAIDHSVNDVVVWAERDVIVMHEPTLLHAAAQVDLT